MKISLLILSWFFSCLHIQRIGIKYTAVYRSVVLKNNTLGTVDIIFITKLQLLIFFHFSDLRNLVKCMVPCMVPCYSLLSMKVIWLHMISAPPPITMREGREGGVTSYGKLRKFCGDKRFSYICGRINLYEWS